MPKPRTSKSLTKRTRKREKPKAFAKYTLTQPLQLTLFTAAPDTPDSSYTVELYDFIPKYVWGKLDRIDGTFLHPLEREFEYRGRKLKLTLVPAFVKDGDQQFIACFPGKREELVEDALRKMMSDDTQGIFLDGEASVTFTIYQLQKELKTQGHSYSRDELKASIRILYGTDITITSEDGKQELAFSPIETYGFNAENEETQTFVRFSPFVTESIKKGTYRLLNYETVMGYRSAIARQLHKRISHHYIQASLLDPYSILLSTMLRDFGLTQQKRLQQNLQKVTEALDEMSEQSVLLSYEAHKIFSASGQKRLVDVKFSLQPHPQFINEVKRANAKTRALQSQLQNLPDEENE